MTSPAVGPEKRVTDFNSQQAAYQKNAAMRGEIHRDAASQEAAHIDNMTGESASERRAKNYHAENIDLRGQLEMSRKATSAAQELLEAERAKVARLEAQMTTAWNAYQTHAIELPKQLSAALDTEKLLRTNDAATIADLQRQLREAQGQLVAQGRRMRGPFGDPVWDSKGVSQWVRTDWANAQISKTRREANAMIDSHKAENVELRHLLEGANKSLDTEKLLRVNDAATIADLQRQLREAEGQLKAQRINASSGEWSERQRARLATDNYELEKMVLEKNDEIAKLDKQLKAQRVGSITGNVFHPWMVETAKLKELAAEVAELRRTISLMAKTAAEVQDNFRLIAELAADPADEKRKENTK